MSFNTDHNQRDRPESPLSFVLVQRGGGSPEDQAETVASGTSSLGGDNPDGARRPALTNGVETAVPVGSQSADATAAATVVRRPTTNFQQIRVNSKWKAFW